MINPTMYNGMRVIESLSATTAAPVRKYKVKRRHLLQLEKQIGKTGCKHPFTQYDRLKKKWLKRYGTKQVPGCFIMDPSALMVGNYPHGNKVMVAHPTITKALKEVRRDIEIKPSNDPLIKYDAMLDGNKSILDRKKQHYDSILMEFYRSGMFLNPNGAVNMDTTA